MIDWQEKGDMSPDEFRVASVTLPTPLRALMQVVGWAEPG
jgi:hypothetical protein